MPSDPMTSPETGGDRFGGDNRGDDISNGGNRHLTARELFMRRGQGTGNTCRVILIWLDKYACFMLFH